MRSQSEMYDYQRHAEDHVMENKHCGLFMEMGLGKTIVCLSAIRKLMYHDFEISKVLVIAPKWVAMNVWTDEIKEWAHVNMLTTSVMTGLDEIGRIKALKKKADIYIINCDLIAWLIARGGFKFDMVIIDESSKFKNHDSKRFKALKVVMPLVKRCIILTGTPIGNGLIDLWAQMYLLDRGQRLGRTISEYRVMYFSPGAVMGHIVLKYALKEKALEKVIYHKIGDICISMKQKDYLQLPPMIEKTINVELPDKTQEQYEEFEETQVLKLLMHEDGDNISAINAAVLTNKLLQFANGAVYDENKVAHLMHNEKLDALGDIIETSQGQNIIVFYQFRSDLERILKRFKARLLKTRQDMIDWNNGLIKLMVAHAASAGHGLNLQAGGHIIIWFGQPWSLELVQQANKRLHRPGIKKPVLIYKLMCLSTMDRDVLNAQNRKAKGQDALMDAVKALVKKYT